MYTESGGDRVKRTNLFLDDQDREALRVIKEAHGLATDSSAARFAIREVAREIERRTKRDEARERQTVRRPAMDARNQGEE
jgi:hypothetical protein